MARQKVKRQKQKRHKAKKKLSEPVAAAKKNKKMLSSPALGSCFNQRSESPRWPGDLRNAGITPFSWRPLGLHFCFFDFIPLLISSPA